MDGESGCVQREGNGESELTGTAAGCCSSLLGWLVRRCVWQWQWSALPLSRRLIRYRQPELTRPTNLDAGLN